MSVGKSVMPPGPIWKYMTVHRFFWDLGSKRDAIVWTNLRFHLDSHTYDAQYSCGFGNTYHPVETLPDQWESQHDDDWWQASIVKAGFPSVRGDPVDLSDLKQAAAAIVCTLP